jgi:hypothetical protein
MSNRSVLLTLDQVAKIWDHQVEDHKDAQENMENTHATISHEILPNSELKEKMAKLQDGFFRLTNENRKLTSMLR